MEYKTCSNCKVSLPLDNKNFSYKNKSELIFSNYCKPCACAKTKQIYKNNPYKVMKRVKNWREKQKNDKKD